MLTSDGSDSEHLFHYLLTKLAYNDQNKSQLEKLADALVSLPVEYTALNSLLCNGKDLFVIRRHKIYPDYYTLYYHMLPNGVIVCSEPIECRNVHPNHWEMIPNDSCLRIHGSPPQIDKY